MYDTIRDSVVWERSIGDAEVPGLPTLADPVTIPARIVESLQDTGNDVVSDIQFTVFPEHEVQSRDRIDGAEILNVVAARDGAGNVKWRTCYGKR